MATVQLGNAAAHQWVADKKHPKGGQFEALEGDRITTVDIPDDYSLSKAFIAITDPNGVWGAHSAGEPAWVECNDEDLGKLLASHYNCPIGRPKGWGK